MKNNNQDNDDLLLREIIRRRNKVWYWVPEGFLIFVAIMAFYMGFFGEPPLWFPPMLLILWGIVGMWLVSRISEVKCPECGDSALKASPVIYGKIRCQWCGHKFN